MACGWGLYMTIWPLFCVWFVHASRLKFNAKMLTTPVLIPFLTLFKLYIWPTACCRLWNLPNEIMRASGYLDWSVLKVELMLELFYHYLKDNMRCHVYMSEPCWYQTMKLSVIANCQIMTSKIRSELVVGKIGLVILACYANFLLYNSELQGMCSVF